MQKIKLNATNWSSVLDFYNALLAALGAPEGHGRNINALVDSMIYGGINKIDPPYTVEIRGAASLSPKLRDEIKFEIGLLLKARDQAYAPDGGDVQLEFDTDL